MEFYNPLQGYLVAGFFIFLFGKKQTAQETVAVFLMGKSAMGIDSNQLLRYVIKPALTLLDMASPAAEALLLGTAAQESHCGRYLHQLGNGPALGIFQMEPATYHDIWENYIAYRPKIQKQLAILWPVRPEPEEMVVNLLLAAVMSRIHYRRVPVPLPQAEDLSGLADYWKKYFNSSLGRGTTAEFITNWHRFLEN